MEALKYSQLEIQPTRLNKKDELDSTVPKKFFVHSYIPNFVIFHFFCFQYVQFGIHMIIKIFICVFKQKYFILWGFFFQLNTLLQYFTFQSLFYKNEIFEIEIFNISYNNVLANTYSELSSKFKRISSVKMLTQNIYK